MYLKHSRDRARGVDVSCAGTSEGKALVGKLELYLGKSLKAGRMVTPSGLPFDVEDQDPSEGGIAITAVDRGAFKDLVDELRRAGFKVKPSGSRDIVITASHGDVTCSVVGGNIAMLIKKARDNAEMQAETGDFTDADKRRLGKAVDLMDKALALLD